MTEPDWYRKRNYIHFDRRVGVAGALRASRDSRAGKNGPSFPLLRVTLTIPRYDATQGKTTAKERPILYAGHRDAHIMSFWAWRVSRVYSRLMGREPLLDAAVLAYRALGKGNVDLACETFNAVDRLGSAAVFCFDVESFFESIHHNEVLDGLKLLLGGRRLPEGLFRAVRVVLERAQCSREEVLKVLGLDASDLRRRDRICDPRAFRADVRANGLITKPDNPIGIPQGSPLSAVLANTAMIRADREVAGKVAKLGGIYRRYSDDVLIALPGEVDSAIGGELMKPLEDRGLRVQPAKTTVHQLQDGAYDVPLSYLGLVYDGRVVRLRHGGIARFQQRACSRIRAEVYRSWHTEEPVRRRGLYRGFTHLGSKNYFGYAKMAERIVKRHGLKSGCQAQLRRHWSFLHRELDRVRSRMEGTQS